MSEVSYSSIQTPVLISKSFKNAYSIVADKAYVKQEVENKEMIFLTRSMNRMEQNMEFMQREHCQMLEGLQKQIEKLREENQELQFQLVMRSDRPTDSVDRRPVAIGNTVLGNGGSSEPVPDRIAQLTSALQDEKRKNSSLLEQLQQARERRAEEPDIDQPKSEKSSFSEDGYHISSDIRITLNPLAVSTYQHESGLYLMKTPLTIQDCEMVIRKLLQKTERNASLRDRSDSMTSLSSSQRLKVMPGLKKPLQPIKPLTHGASGLKFNHQSTFQNGNHIGLPPNQKLMPILSEKPQNAKLEQTSQRHSLHSRKSEVESKEVGSLTSVSSEARTGTSLPALPKPNDYNQAEKHRRLHLLQRRRLDQYNNRL